MMLICLTTVWYRTSSVILASLGSSNLIKLTMFTILGEASDLTEAFGLKGGRNEKDIATYISVTVSRVAAVLLFFNAGS